MADYLQEIKSLVKLRIRSRTMATLKNVAYEAAADVVVRSDDKIREAMKDKGITEEDAIRQYITAMKDAAVDVYFKEKGAELVDKVPGIIASEAGQIGGELTHLLKEASTEAMKEIVAELSAGK